MKIELSKEKFNELNNFRNGKGITLAKVVAYGNKKFKVFILKPKTSIGLHSHEHEEETIYILKGKALFTDNNEEYVLNEGDLHIYKKQTNHAIRNDSDEDLEFLSFVTIND